MFLMHAAYYEANITSVYLGAYAAKFIPVIRSTDVIGALALGLPNNLALPNTLCNDPFVAALKGGLTTIVEVLIALGVVIAVIGVVIGGLMRATAWGSEQRIAMSNKAISSAIIGLIIMLLAVALGNAVPNWFGLQNNTCILNPASTPVSGQNP